MNKKFAFPRFSLLSIFVCCILHTSHGQEQMPIQQSFQTLHFLLPEQAAEFSDAETEELIGQLADQVEYWNDYAKEGDPGWRQDILQSLVRYGVDELVDMASRPPLWRIPAGTAGSWLNEKLETHLFEKEAKEYARKRDFKVRETFERTATAIVEDHCSGNQECAEAVFNQVLNDPDVQKQIDEADALGAFDEAQTRAYVKNAQEKSLGNYEGSIIEIDNLATTINAAVSDVKTTLINNFQEVNDNQQHIIRNTAEIMHLQQENTIALANLQEIVTNNLEIIDTKVDNITALQQENLFISEAILEGVVEIDTRITALSKSFSEVRKEQKIEKIQNIFDNSPINKKIMELENKNSAISLLLGEEKRQKVLAELEVVKQKQDIVNVTNFIGRVGKVGQEALSVFCQNRECPSEIQKSINLGLAVTDIVGNFTTGNWAKASLTVLGIFKEPQPSPELQMLNQISKQLEGLEANMNQGFKNVHEHLFALEENLGQRLNIIEFKIDQLTSEMIQTRQDILQSLSLVDTKLNYIVNQNECIKDLILEVTLEQNQDLCRLPAETFSNRLVNDEISNYKDLENFFRGGSCGSCIEGLFKVKEQAASPFFRYTQCNAEGQNNKSAPHRIYDFTFNKLLDGTSTDQAIVHSLLFVPKNVLVLDSLKNALNPLSDSISFGLTKEDRHYRNYKAVLDYAHYLLTLFPFLELYDSGHLLSPDEIRENPGLSEERTLFLISKLEGTLELINHTILQQSLMAGSGVFHTVDKMLENGISGFDESGNFTLPDLFSYNPYFRKNYAAHLLDEVVGFETIKDLVEHGRLKKGDQRIVMNGYNIQISEEDNDPVFRVSLTNQEDPEKHILLFDGYLPLLDGKIDEETYERNLEFAYPSSITELSEMKQLVINRLGEMRMIASSELDQLDTALSRTDLAKLIVLFRE